MGNRCLGRSGILPIYRIWLPLSMRGKIARSRKRPSIDAPPGAVQRLLSNTGKCQEFGKRGVIIKKIIRNFPIGFVPPLLFYLDSCFLSAIEYQTIRKSFDFSWQNHLFDWPGHPLLMPFFL
jgi:hypothetical protein